MIKGILIDVGDTLIHNYNIDFSNALSKVYDCAISPNVSREQYIEYGSKLLKDIFNARSGIEFKMIDFLKQVNEFYQLNFFLTISELEEVFAMNYSNISYVENAVELLSYLKRKNYKIIIISNTSFSKEVIIKMLGEMMNYIDDVIVSSDYPLKKPHFGIFDIGISRLRLPKDKIYYIGNSFYHDVKGAIKAGIKSVWFNKDNNLSDNNVIGQYHEIKSYLELIKEDF